MTFIFFLRKVIIELIVYLIIYGIVETKIYSKFSLKASQTYCENQTGQCIRKQHVQIQTNGL